MNRRAAWFPDACRWAPACCCPDPRVRSSLRSWHSGEAAAPCSVAPGSSHTISEPASPFVKWTHISLLGLHCPRRSSESKQGSWAWPSPSPHGEPAWGLQSPRGSRTSPEQAQRSLCFLPRADTLGPAPLSPLRIFCINPTHLERRTFRNHCRMGKPRNQAPSSGYPALCLFSDRLCKVQPSLTPPDDRFRERAEAAPGWLQALTVPARPRCPK